MDPEHDDNHHKPDVSAVDFLRAASGKLEARLRVRSPCGHARACGGEHQQGLSEPAGR